MKLMFDTHSFIWWATDPSRLSPRVLTLCQDSSTDLILSVVSLWEIQIKAQLGKLVLTVPLPALIATQLIATQLQVNHIRILPVELSHVLQLDSLPLHHKDPFDRLLIAQAICEGASFASVDTLFALYPVVSLW